MIKPCDNWSTFLAYDGPNVIGRPGLANDGRATFVHGPGLDDPLLGVVRFQNDAKELMWVTDGRGRQYAVGGVVGHDPAAIAPNIDFSGQSGYWGWQWVGGTKRSYGFTAGRQSSAGSAGAFSVFRNRLYDPATGRWTQEDPIGVAGGVNLYQFNGNNPAAYTDPFGLCIPMPWCLRTQAQNLASAVEPAARAVEKASNTVVAGVSGTLGNATCGATAGGVSGSGCGVSFNSPSAGASFDVGAKFRDASDDLATGGVTFGVGKHLGVTITNETFMVNIGISTPTVSPVTVTVDLPKTLGPEPPRSGTPSPDATAVEKPLGIATCPGPSCPLH